MTREILVAILRVMDNETVYFREGHEGQKAIYGEGRVIKAGSGEWKGFTLVLVKSDGLEYYMHTEDLFSEIPDA